MVDAKSLRAIEEDVCAVVGGGGAASVDLARLLDAIEHGAPSHGDARTGIDSLARRLQLDYHINGPRGVIVFRAADAR